MPALDEQIREAIVKCGRSLNQLARACGVSPGQLSRFVNGERALSLPAAAKVVRTLGLALYPVGSTPPANPTPPARFPPAKPGRPRTTKKPAP